MNPSLMFQLQITDAEGNRRTIPLPATTSIGRQEGNDLLLDDQRVSRRHAKIECSEELCHITDLGSSNGTTVDGERLHANVPVAFAPGTVAEIGGFELALTAVPVPEPVREAEVPAAPEEPEETPKAAEPPPPEPPSAAPPAYVPDDMVPPGLTLESRRLLTYLPGIYQTSFMARFLGIFEAILTPIEWNIDNFDLYLDPGTAPMDFVPWLASWFDVAFDPSWTEAQRRSLLSEAHDIYARRGTKWALGRTIEICTGHTPVIIDADPDTEPFTFKVVLPKTARSLDREMVERLVDAHKPAHTLYTLDYER